MKKLLLFVLVVLSACSPREVRIDAACRAEHPYQAGLGDPCRTVVGEPRSMQSLVP